MTENQNQTMGHLIDTLGDFLIMMDTYTRQTRDYGNGEKHTMLEMHTLHYIYENEGVMGTQIAQKWHRTLGAVSKIVDKLVQKDLVERRVYPGNRKNIHLFLTKKGLDLCQKYESFGSQWGGEGMEEIFDGCTGEDIVKFSDILDKCYALIDRKLG